jgi:hypothetical protein
MMALKSLLRIQSFSVLATFVLLDLSLVQQRYLLYTPRNIPIFGAQINFWIAEILYNYVSIH